MRASAALLALLLLGSSSAAEEIGSIARLRPRVVSFPPGEGRELRVQDPVERGLKVRLEGRDSYLKVALHSGGSVTRSGPWTGRIAGTASLEGGGEVEFGDSVRLLLGKLRIALIPGEDLSVESPDMVSGAKGTYFRVLVDPAIGTFLAVDEGAVEVQARAGGAPVLVTAGHWVLVPRGGLPTRPAPLPSGTGGPGGPGDVLDDPPLLGCCPGTEPPKSLPEGPP